MQPLTPIQREPLPLPYAAPQGPESDGFSLKTLLGALRLRKRLILTTIAVTLVAVFGLMQLLPEHYTATADLEITPADTHAVVSRPVATGLPQWLPGDNSVMETQVHILQARAPTAQVVRRLGLADDPDFQSTLSRGLRWTFAVLHQWLPESWLPAISWMDRPGTPAEREDTAVQKLQRALTIKQTKTGHIIQIGVTTSDPEKSARIANAVVQQYLHDQIAAKEQTTERALEWAQNAVRAQRKELVAAEDAAVKYMAVHRLTASNGFAQPIQAPPGRSTFGGLAGQQLFSLQDELTAARAQFAAKQARVAELDAMQARHISFASLPEVTSSPVIAELEKADAKLRAEQSRIFSTYGTNSAVLRVIRAQRSGITEHIAAVVAGIAQNIRDTAVTAHDRVVRLEQMLNHGREEYIKAERASVGLRELTGGIAAKREVYGKLLLRESEINQQLALIQPDATVVSAAVPPIVPSFPNRLVFTGLGLLGSLLFAGFLAAFAENSDKTLRTGGQVEKALGVTNFGLVPRLKTRRRGEPLYTAICRQPQSVYAEVIRTVLMQLLRPRAKVVLVTSALPREGKTVTAMSLAAAAARSGRRTVLVDCDLRCPAVATEAKLKVCLGLAEFLSRKASLKEVVHVDPSCALLHIIPLRSAVREPAEMFCKWDIAGLINTLRENYDCVFLDMPPSVAASDIQPFVDFADSTLFVVRWGSTSHSAALNGMTVLSRIGLQISGVALTQADLGRHALYGYEQFGEYHLRYLEYFSNREPTS